MKQFFLSENVEMTAQIASDFAKTMQGNETIAMFGDLGAGKTTFIKAFCKELAIDEDTVTSPTFAIVNEYSGKFRVFHFDMYRISSEDDLEAIGFFDCIYENSVKLIEWSENIIDFITPDIKIYINHTEKENRREIVIERSKAL